MSNSKDIMDKIKNGREYRNISDIKTQSADIDTAHTVKGYATVFDLPYKLHEDREFVIYEKIDPLAFEKCDMRDVIFQFNHEGRVYARKSNGTLKVEADAHGLAIEAYLGGTEEGRKLWEDIHGGYITKMSFGFTVRKDEIEENEENGITVYTRTVKEISKLYDVSAVSIPANDATQITARAFSDGLIAEAVSERNKMLQKQKDLLSLKIKLIKEI